MLGADGLELIAHETIFDMRSELGESERADELLRASARIATVEMAAINARARGLATTWYDQRVLDPETAEATLAALEAELSRIQPLVEQARAPHRRVAADLRRLLSEQR